MAKIDFVDQTFSQQQDQVLDIFQIQILNMYDILINEENFRTILRAIGSNGYIIPIRQEGKRFRFYGVDANYERADISLFVESVTVQDKIDWGLIIFCKKILTLWHQKIALEYRIWEGNKYTRTDIVYPDLTERQRGMLTKILKLNNRRKMFEKKLSKR